MNESARLQFLFNKHLKNLCTEAERQELALLLRRARAEDILNDTMKDLWNHYKDNSPEYDVDWDKMYRQVTMQGDESSRERPFYRMGWTKIAAAGLVMLSATGIFLYLHHKPVPQTPPAVAFEKVHARTVKHKKTIHLPDGSTVILNDGSTLNYPTAFDGKTREVYLIGEGYFDVRHDPDKFFLVHAGHLITKVLGTAFDIKAYPEASTVEITVTRGRVQVIKGNKSLGLLSSNQQIAFSNKTESVDRRMVDAKNIVNWQSEDIFFDDITMEDAARQIEKQFGTVIEFENPGIKECRVSATFSGSDSMDEMLTVICSVTKVNYKLSDHKIIIYGKGCQ